MSTTPADFPRTVEPVREAIARAPAQSTARVLHIVLAHLAAGITGLIHGYGFEIFTAPLMQPPAGWGFPLTAVYLAWVGVMLIAYPLCRWFADLKRRRNDWWLAYL